MHNDIKPYYSKSNNIQWEQKSTGKVSFMEKNISIVFLFVSGWNSKIDAGISEQIFEMRVVFLEFVNAMTSHDL